MMKQLIYANIPSGFLQSATAIQGQLHAVVEDVTDHIEAVYAATWDGQSKYVEVLKGDLSIPKMAYLGWPTEDAATYQARIAKEIKPGPAPDPVEPVIGG